MRRHSDAARFVELLKPLERQLEWYARRMLRDPSSAADVLQDALLKAYQGFAQFTAGTNFKAWIFRYLAHQILNANRRHEPVQLSEIPVDLPVEETWELPEAEAAFERLLDDPERLLDLLEGPVARGLSRLAAAERSCLLLKSIGEFSYHEIHELLGIPIASVMGYLARARRRMRVFLEAHAAETGWPHRLPDKKKHQTHSETPGYRGPDRATEGAP